MGKRDLLTVGDLTRGEIDGLISKAMDFKGKKGMGDCPLIGKSVGLYFEKSSTRTRVSFEVAVYQLGGQAIYLTGLQTGRGEGVADTARVLSRYLDAIVVRTFKHSTMEDWAHHAGMPVINGLTDLHHPCQALSDLMTIFEKKGSLKGIRIAYIGDGNNVANSLIEAATMSGMHITVSCPKGYEPDKDIVERAKVEASKGEGGLEIVRDPYEAARDADVIYTDVWVSMGQEKEISKRKKAFKDYQVNNKVIEVARPDVIVMHCLPANRGEEITSEVMDGKHSVILDQAENRLHMQKAILCLLLSADRQRWERHSQQ